jgi:hypothetical protein
MNLRRGTRGRSRGKEEERKGQADTEASPRAKGREAPAAMLMRPRRVRERQRAGLGMRGAPGPLVPESVANKDGRGQRRRGSHRLEGRRGVQDKGEGADWMRI